MAIWLNVPVLTGSWPLVLGRYLHQANPPCPRFNYYIYVTGFAKTDHNVTLGQLHFIGPANSRTRTVPMYCCIDGLSCFSGAVFANHVKS